MPTTVRDLWEEVTSWENLVAAYQATRKGRRYQPEILRFHQRWEERLLNIHEHLRHGTWEPRPLTAFWVREPKPRLIEAPAYPDRIVHHAIHQVVEPHFERRFYAHSYACRRGKGTHQAVKAVQRYMRRADRRWRSPVVLQCDISKYFHSVNHDRLVEQLGRTIGDRRLMGLWEQIIRGAGRDHGMPIGALTSQLSANAYLDVLDRFVKDDCGEPYYVRYMDDFVFMAPDSAYAARLRRKVEHFLQDELMLRLNPKTRVYPAHQGINFSGYRTWPGHIRPRKRNLRRAARRMRVMSKWHREGRVTAKEVHQVAASFLGYVQHCHASRAREMIVDHLESMEKPSESLAMEAVQ